MEFKVILFEDDDLIRLSLERALASKGYEVLTASDPTLCKIFQNEGSSCCQCKPCGDFILTDNAMPNMSGLDFIELQTIKGCKGIIRNKAVMSAFWSEEDLSRAKKLGCKVFHKPFDIGEIINWLEERKSLLLSDSNSGPFY